MVGGESLVRRELLRINDGDRRFELRPHGTPGSVCLDLAPGLMHATLSGHDRATLDNATLGSHGVAAATLTSTTAVAAVIGKRARTRHDNGKGGEDSKHEFTNH